MGTDLWDPSGPQSPRFTPGVTVVSEAAGGWALGRKGWLYPRDHHAELLFWEKMNTAFSRALAWGRGDHIKGGGGLGPCESHPETMSVDPLKGVEGLADLASGTPGWAAKSW